MPGARLSLVDTGKDRVAWSGRSFGDGRVPFYPNLVVPHAGIPAAGSAPEGGWLVQVEKDGVMSSTRWDGLNRPMKARARALDSVSSHLAPPQSKWVFLPRLGGCESLSAALFSGRRCG